MECEMLDDLAEMSRFNMILFYRDELTRLYYCENVVLAPCTRRRLYRLGIIEYAHGGAGRGQKLGRFSRMVLGKLDEPGSASSPVDRLTKA